MSASPPHGPVAATPAIRTVLLCDLVASTAVVERLGDAAAAGLLARHDRIARDLLAALDGREIDKSDGFLLLFDRPIEAVRFALAYQSGLRELGAEFGVPIASRVGIHLGEVVLRGNPVEDVSRGAKPLEVEGLAKAIAARVMALAGDGRILLTRSACDVARRAAVGLEDLTALRWTFHGYYRLAGIDEPVDVWEVGAAGPAPVSPPADVDKAHRLGSGGSADAGRSVSGRPSSEPVLAVLAFDNLSNDPEMQFFSDGVSEDIIQRVSRGAKLKVIGRTSSFQFRGDRKAEAAGRLSCTHVLDGSIRRAGERVRISAHLVEAATTTTLWSDRYDGGLGDIFAVQDEISQNIAAALDRTFSAMATEAVDPAVYDLYLRASPRSYAPDELRACVGLLEVVTQRAPAFAAGWGRLAYLRAWLLFYRPFAERPAAAALVEREAGRALEIDAENADAMTAQLFVLPPFGSFVETDAALRRVRRLSGLDDKGSYVSWFLRSMGRVRESLEEAERAYRLDALNTMTANLAALARMAAGREAEAVPVFEQLVAQEPDMSFPLSSLLRTYAFLEDWPAVDRLLALAARRQLREFQDGLAFIRAKRDPTPQNVGAWWSAQEAHVAKNGWVDVSRLVYAAHLGLVDDAYRAAERSRLGPGGTDDDIMGPDAYRPALMFQAAMPELRNDPRFPRLCARLGLVEFWMASDLWPDCADQVPYDFRAACADVRSLPKDMFWP